MAGFELPNKWPLSLDHNFGLNDPTPDNWLEQIVFTLETSRPLIRLLVQVGAMPTLLEINPGPNDSSQTQTPDGGAMRFDLGRHRAVFHRDWDLADFDGHNRLLLPILGRIDGMVLTFKVVTYDPYPLNILLSFDPSALSHPDATTIRVEPGIEENEYHLVLDLSSPGVTDLNDFAAKFLTQVRHFVRDWLDLVQTAAGAFDTSLGRPVGPTGLLLDPFHWAPQFRWGEDGGGRKARIDALDRIIGPIWTDVGQDAPAFRTFLEQEILGVEGTDGQRKAVTAEDRLKQALSGLFSGAEARNRLEEWRLILKLDIENVERTFNGAHDFPPPPEPDEIASWSLTDLVTDAIARRLVTYQGASFLRPLTMRQSGFELHASVLKPFEHLLTMVEPNWRDNRVAAHEALKTLYSMMWDIRDVMLGHSSAATILPNRSQSSADKKYDDTSFIDELSGDYYFSGFSLNYPDEATGAFDKLVVATDQVDLILRKSQREIRMNWEIRDQILSGMTDRYIFVTSEERHDMWRNCAVALTAVDRFFEAGQWNFGLEGMAEQFVSGVLAGVGDNVGDRYYRLVKESLKAAPINGIFPPILMAGMISGIAKKVNELLWKVYHIVTDPIAFIAQMTKMIETMFATPPQDMAFIFGKCLGEAASKEADKLLKQRDTVHFIFAMGELLGPIVLEVVLSILFEVYIIAPIINAARPLLMAMMNGVMDTMPGGGMRAALRELAEADLDPSINIDLSGDYPDIEATLPPISDAPPLNRSSALDPDVMDDMSGTRLPDPDPGPDPNTPPTMTQETADVIDVDETGGPKTAQETIDELNAMDDDVRYVQAAEPERQTSNWDQQWQQLKQEQIAHHRDALKDALNHPDYANLGVSITQTRYQLTRLVHDRRFMDPQAATSLIRLLGPDSPLSLAERQNLVRGLVRVHNALNGLNYGGKFRSFANHYLQLKMNYRVFEILGRPDVVIDPTDWLDAAYPDVSIHEHLPVLLARGLKNAEDVEDAIAPLHHGLRKAVRDAYNNPDKYDLPDPIGTVDIHARADRFNFVDQELALSGATAVQQALHRSAFERFGLYLWGFHKRVPRQTFAIPHPDWPNRPGSIEMWLKRNPNKRTAADDAVQQSVSGIYNDAPNFEGKYHASHLIPHRHGGPSSVDNLAAAPERANLSFMAEVEKHLDWAMARYGEDNIYLKAIVHDYDDYGLPKNVQYYVYSVDPDNGNMPRLVEEFYTRLDFIEETAVDLNPPGYQMELLLDGGD